MLKDAREELITQVHFKPDVPTVTKQESYRAEARERGFIMLESSYERPVAFE